MCSLVLWLHKTSTMQIYFTLFPTGQVSAAWRLCASCRDQVGNRISTLSYPRSSNKESWRDIAWGQVLQPSRSAVAITNTHLHLFSPYQFRFPPDSTMHLLTSSNLCDRTYQLAYFWDVERNQSLWKKPIAEIAPEVRIELSLELWGNISNSSATVPPYTDSHWTRFSKLWISKVSWLFPVSLSISYSNRLALSIIQISPSLLGNAANI